MAALTRTYDPAEGPLLNVKICPQGETEGPVLSMLMDTGADGSSISSDVIEALSLSSFSRKRLFASGGDQGLTRLFVVDIAIPFDDGEIFLPDITVAEFKFLKPSVRGLLGRDILCRGDFQMRNDQYFTFEI